MTDYKALYEQQLQENKKLKEENQKWYAWDGGDGDEIFGNRVWSLLYDFKLCPTSYGEAVSFIKDLFEENKKLKEENKSELGINYKELYEAQQEETDIEHQRYLQTAEKYSNRLWEVCQELDIENDDTSQNIIQAINELKEENANWEADDANFTKVLYMLHELDDDFPVSGVDDLYQYVKKLIEQNEELTKQNDKWCEIISSLDADDWCEMLEDAGWEYNEENELVRVEQ